MAGRFPNGELFCSPALWLVILTNDRRQSSFGDGSPNDRLLPVILLGGSEGMPSLFCRGLPIMLSGLVMHGSLKCCCKGDQCSEKSAASAYFL